MSDKKTKAVSKKAVKKAPKARGSKISASALAEEKVA